jgi:hypothetical protein
MDAAIAPMAADAFARLANDADSTAHAPGEPGITGPTREDQPEEKGEPEHENTDDS